MLSPLIAAYDDNSKVVLWTFSAVGLDSEKSLYVEKRQKEAFNHKIETQYA